MNGTLFGIGTGPGDPEMITCKSLEILKKTQNLIFPNKDAQKCRAYEIVKQKVDLSGKNLIFMDFPMTTDPKILEDSQKTAAEKICFHLKKGENVAFLTIGDPTVYSTYIYVQNFVENMGFSAEIVNGITSFCSVAAKLGISLSSQNEEIHIIPGNYEIADSFLLHGTLIFMKSGKKLQELKDFLISCQQNYDFEFYAVSNCSLKDEILCRSLKEFNPTTAGYLTVAIVKNVRPKAQSSFPETQKNYSFFQNKKCEMFPCHQSFRENQETIDKIDRIEDFNCLFCYCPLYYLGEKCGGNFTYSKSGKKSCVNCSYPHRRQNYAEITKRLKG